MELGVTAVMLPDLDFDEQLSLMLECGVKYYQIRPRIIPEAQVGEPWNPWGNHKFDLTPRRLVKEGKAITQQVRDRGLDVWGTLPALTIEADPDEIKIHLDGAAEADAGRVRCGMPRYPDEPFSYEDFLKRVVEGYEKTVGLAEPLGVKLIIETHSLSFATSPALAWNICRHFDPAQVGVIFDLANFTREGEITPHLAVSVLRDYIDCVHIGGGRRLITDVDELGCNVIDHQMCPLDRSDLYLPPWLEALHAAQLGAPLIIEDFTPNMSGPDRLRNSSALLHKAMAKLN